MAGKTILIVDDDADIRLALSVRLRAHGYQIALAADAMTVMTEARKAKPDLILLDLGLPAGDGFVVMDRLRLNTQLGAIPVIVVSARDSAAFGQRALKAGARAYIQKPVDDEELLRHVREAIGEA